LDFIHTKFSIFGTPKYHRSTEGKDRAYPNLPNTLSRSRPAAPRMARSMLVLTNTEPVYKIQHNILLKDKM